MIELKPIAQLNKSDATDKMFVRHPENFQEGSRSVRLDDLLPFQNHPYKVLDDDEMDQLADSIRENGVLTAVVARKHPANPGKYEIISGHRRCHAAKLAGLDEVPCRVIEANDDTATIMMTDTNLQREHVLPSEKAFAYKMRYDALKSQGKRTDLTSNQIGWELNKNTSGQIVQKSTAEEMESAFREKYKTIQRYIRLTFLLHELLDKIDADQIPVNVGVDLSYLTEPQQQIVLDYLNETEKNINLKLSGELHAKAGNMTDAELTKLLYASAVSKKSPSLSIPSDRLDRWFKPTQDKKERLDIIDKALEEYLKKKREGD